MEREIIKSREVNWPVPIATDHREYTVTEKCYLIESGNPCFGCTVVNVQKAEAGVIYEGGLRMNVNFVTEVAQQQADEGINLLTYMGGEPLTIRGFEEVIRWTSNHPTLTALVYSSSAYFFKAYGELSRRFFSYEKAGLFGQKNYFLSSVDRLIPTKDEIPPDDDASAFKSYWGLKLATKLARRGYHDTAIHQTLRTDNLNQTLKLYSWAKDHGVKFSLCPIVWKPYTSRGITEEFYSRHLHESDKPQLREIVAHLIEEETGRIRRGEARQIIPSSAFLRLIPEFGPDNILSCREHREGKQPNTQDIHPSREERWCIAQNTEADGQVCQGCHYVGIDRGKSDYWHFEHLAGPLKPGDLRWLNYHVWTKDPHFDPSRRNIAFEVVDNNGGLKPLPALS